jgi:hypothetical protein
MRKLWTRVAGLTVIALASLVLSRPTVAEASVRACGTVGYCSSGCPTISDVMSWCAEQASAHNCTLAGGGCNDDEGGCAPGMAYVHCHEGNEI